MSSAEYATHVSEMICAANAMDVVIEKLWDKDMSGEAFLLEKIRDTVNTGATAIDDIVTAKGGYGTV